VGGVVNDLLDVAGSVPLADGSVRHIGIVGNVRLLQGQTTSGDTRRLCQ
jgi:hypothetical protein